MYQKHRSRRDKIDIINTQIHDRSLSWLAIGISIKNGGVKLVLCVQTSPIFSFVFATRNAQYNTQVIIQLKRLLK